MNEPIHNSESFENLSSEDIGKFITESQKMFPFDFFELLSFSETDIAESEKEQKKKRAKIFRVIVLRDLHIALRAALQLYGGTITHMEYTDNNSVFYTFSLKNNHPYYFNSGLFADAFVKQFFDELLTTAKNEKDGADAIDAVANRIRVKIVLIIFSGVEKLINQTNTNQTNVNGFTFN